MKKIVLSLVSVLALSTTAFGEDTVEMNSIYIGIGAGQSYLENKATDEEFTSAQTTLFVGYQPSKYAAFEARYSFGMNDDYDSGSQKGIVLAPESSISYWGLYLKPMYPIGNFNLYGLLGFGGEMLSDINGGDAYQVSYHYGVGASYDFLEHFNVFVDYTCLLEDNQGFDYVATKDRWKSSAWTLGASYKF